MILIGSSDNKSWLGCDGACFSNPRFSSTIPAAWTWRSCMAQFSQTERMHSPRSQPPTCVCLPMLRSDSYPHNITKMGIMVSSYNPPLPVNICISRGIPSLGAFICNWDYCFPSATRMNGSWKYSQIQHGVCVCVCVCAQRVTNNLAVAICFWHLHRFFRR